RCQGGAGFFSGTDGYNQAVSWTPGNGAWSFTSDRNTKENLQLVDAAAVLERVTRLPLHHWNYIGYEQRHLGPMAQDFHDAFPWSGDARSLNSADLDGVALAAIQGLSQKLAQKEMEMTELKQKNQSLERRLESLERIIRNKN